eukprot:8389465-Ditylum_brightwellii.AAC.1
MEGGGLGINLDMSCTDSAPASNNGSKQCEKRRGTAGANPSDTDQSFYQSNKLYSTLTLIQDQQTINKII